MATDASSGRRFRSSGQTFGFVAFAASIAIIGVATSFQLSLGRGLFQAVGSLVIAGAMLAGPARAAVWTTRDGVRIRNTVSTRMIPWSEIRAFHIGRHALLGAVCIVDLVDGSSTHAFAIQVPHRALNRPDAKARVMVEELNQILDQRRDTLAAPR